MPDDYVDLKPNVEDHEDTDDEEESSSGLYRWAHLPAMLVFGIFFIALSNSPLRWYVSVGSAYTIYVFFFAFGTVLKDLDDFFGDSRVSLYAAKLLIPHILILSLVLMGVFLWFRARQSLPDWVIHEGRKGSLWDVFGWLVLAFTGIAQGTWMGKKVRLMLGKAEA
jgi:hypothetical protein